MHHFYHDINTFINEFLSSIFTTDGAGRFGNGIHYLEDQVGSLVHQVTSSQTFHIAVTRTAHQDTKVKENSVQDMFIHLV